MPLRAAMAKERHILGAPPPPPPLKLIIMSATLRVQDFTENHRLFPQKTIPVKSVDARQYPVTVHFSKRTRVDTDNVNEALRKVKQIHNRLPDGGVLVFMTGQADIRDLCIRLKEYDTVNQRKSNNLKTGTTRIASMKNRNKTDLEPDRNVIDDGELSDTDDDGDFDFESSLAAEYDDNSRAGRPLLVLPLFSNLPDAEQAKVFREVPIGHRLIVVSTNVAETSLTIPNIRYVLVYISCDICDVW